MHDLVAAQDIIKTALAVAKRNKIKVIDKIEINLGKVIEHNQVITPANLKFNLNLVKKNTIAGKAEFIINEGIGRELSIVAVKGKK
ncbi:hydrogenase maturation nickel metallochaperone HypA [Patescibacteria group bacterium]|nr:hydrogenase maturation nickel metallochaperone HypA [Patescibacteria group bacterium]MBU0964154.1 hydrogenase maturation nickel metallochaperone HypA [Patescibacteria group bacterium]